MRTVRATAGLAIVALSVMLVTAATAVGSSGADVATLLDNPSLSLGDDARASFQAGIADDRVVAVLTAVLEHHRVGVGALDATGRAVTIVTVDSAPVSVTNLSARELVAELAELDPSIRPSEVGTPWVIAEPGFYSDDEHAAHISFAFDLPAPAAPVAPQPMPPTDSPAPVTPQPLPLPLPPVTVPAPITPQSTPLLLPPLSAYGVVKQATIKTIANGLQASFFFAQRPVAGSRLRIVWFHNNKQVRSTVGLRTQKVSSFMPGATDLPNGYWRASLQVSVPGAKWKTVKDVRLRLG